MGDCPNCNHRVPVSFPDINARTRAIQVWLDQGYGRPPQQLKVEQQTSAHRDVSEMSVGEIEAALAEIYRRYPALVAFSRLPPQTSLAFGLVEIGRIADGVEKPEPMQVLAALIGDVWERPRNPRYWEQHEQHMAELDEATETVQDVATVVAERLREQGLLPQKAIPERTG